MKRIVILIVLVGLAGIAGAVVRSASSDKGTVAELRELVSNNGSQDVREETRQTYELSPGARVELGGIYGPVKIETSDTKTAEVYIERTATSQEALARRRVTVDADANRLKIRGETVEHNFFARLFGSRASERITLKLPREISLVARGVSGSLVVGEIDGPVEVAGINGKVQVANAVGTATFKGINGNIVAGLKSVSQDGVTLSGVNGNIELQLPEDFNGDIDARGMNGRVITDLPNVSVDSSRHGCYWARVGNGGNGITAKGINGNIHLTRASEPTAKAANLTQN